jgi:hypothetical protein
MFATGVSGEFRVDVSDDIYFCYNSTFLLRAFWRGL